TMYSAVAERSREVATMRAIGFGGPSVVTSFVFESLCIALVGGALGCLAVLPLNGLTTGAMNWQTFSHLAFAFRVTPVLLAIGVILRSSWGCSAACLPRFVRLADRWRWRCGSCKGVQVLRSKVETQIFNLESTCIQPVSAIIQTAK